MTIPPSPNPRRVLPRVLSRVLLMVTGVAVLAFLDPVQATTVRDIGLIIAAVAGNAFIIEYAIVAPWQKSAPGRNIMGMMVSTAALLDLNLAALILGREYALRPYAGAYVYYALIFFIVGRGWMVWRAQHDAAKAKVDRRAAAAQALTAGFHTIKRRKEPK